MRRLYLALMFLASSPGCANNLAHLDWRPGLSAIDFDGLYEFGYAEYREFAERGAANLLFDRWHGQASDQTGPTLQAIGERVRASPTPAPSGPDYAVEEVSSAGRVSFVDSRTKRSEGEVEWLAATPDRGEAAMLVGTRLAIVVDHASVAIEIGSLLGPTPSGWSFTMIVDQGHPTVFALPEIGGAIAPNEPGYVFEFESPPHAGEPWQISVARVSVSP